MSLSLARKLQGISKINKLTTQELPSLAQSSDDGKLHRWRMANNNKRLPSNGTKDSMTLTPATCCQQSGNLANEAILHQFNKKWFSNRQRKSEELPVA